MFENRNDVPKQEPAKNAGGFHVKKKKKKIKKMGKTVEVLLDEKKLKSIPEPIKATPQKENPEKRSFFKRKKKKAVSEYAEPGADVYREMGAIDRPMLVIILLLICFGSIMVFSASYAYALDDMGDS